MTGMGIWAYSSRFYSKDPIKPFFFVEILLSLLWGLSVLFLKTYFIWSDFNIITFYIIFTMLTLFIWAFVWFEIPLVHEILKKLKIKKEYAVSDIFTFDFAWALIASIAFPLFLLTELWLYYTAIFTGFINLAVSVAFIFEMEKYNQKMKKYLVFSGFVMVVFIFAILAKPTSESYFYQKFYKEPVIYQKHSGYSDIVLTKWWEDFRMYIDWNLQFMSLDEGIYHESLVNYPLKVIEKDESLRVLLLGWWDWLAVRNLLDSDRVWEIILVDLDSEITRLARENRLLVELNNNSLNNEKVKIINKDAFSYLLKEERNKYDFIIADFPDPRNASLSKLYSKEFYTLAYNSLKKDWVFVTQSSNAFFADKAMKSAELSIKSVFGNSSPYHRYLPSFWDWGFIMAKKWWKIEKEFCTKWFCEVFENWYNNLENIKENTLVEPHIIEYYIEWYNKYTL